MLKPHGGSLVNRALTGGWRAEAVRATHSLVRWQIPPDVAYDVENIGRGVMSPLEGFMRQEDFFSVVQRKRLASDVPWTIPIVLDVDREDLRGVDAGDTVALVIEDLVVGLLHVEDVYTFEPRSYAFEVFRTLDAAHPGVARVFSLKPYLVGGAVDLVDPLPHPFARYRLFPRETRLLFREKGWRTVVGFQTRNVPHLGHEYVQKTALTFVDGIFINPVVGRKKPGDFRDEVIISAYESLMTHYYLRERSVLSVLHTDMRYAGPREAIFHAILRKNFGCTHFVVGRDHAGVGNFYPPYAAQEVFEEFPDLGIVPLFFTAFFYCRRCGSVANEKTCPHPADQRLEFSGTGLRRALSRDGDSAALIRPEVAEVIARFEQPFVVEPV